MRISLNRILTSGRDRVFAFRYEWKINGLEWKTVHKNAKIDDLF